MQKKLNKQRLYGYAAFGVVTVFIILAAILSDVHESEYLHGVEWLLFWSLVLYLPIFPLAAMLATGFVGHDNRRSIIGLNLLLTIVFTIFSIASGILFKSWLCLSCAAFVVWIGQLYDERNGYGR